MGGGVDVDDGELHDQEDEGEEEDGTTIGVKTGGTGDTFLVEVVPCKSLPPGEILYSTREPGLLGEPLVGRHSLAVGFESLLSPDPPLLRDLIAKSV